MNVFDRKDHYLVVCEYEDKTRSFVLYLTQDEKIVDLDALAHPGVKTNVRN